VVAVVVVVKCLLRRDGENETQQFLKYTRTQTWRDGFHEE